MRLILLFRTPASERRWRAGTMSSPGLSIGIDLLDGSALFLLMTGEYRDNDNSLVGPIWPMPGGTIALRTP